MYRYYANAAVCVVYLADVHAYHAVEHTPKKDDRQLAKELCASRWLTRGWTLQELIAPTQVQFYDSSWTNLGRLDSDLAQVLADETGIPSRVLLKESVPSEWSIASRMSWASRRQTTRIEDEAYCLLGIFDVSLPLVYGEGRRAFMRLQEEIIRRSTDHSIFAWSLKATESSTGQPEINTELLASTPADFAAHVGAMSVTPRYEDVKEWIESFEMTNLGLRLSLPLVPCNSHLGVYHAVLNCGFQTEQKGPIALNVKRSSISSSSKSKPDPANYDLRTTTFGVAPLQYLPSSKFECDSLHLGRLAVVDEEELLQHEKSQVTILRAHRLDLSNLSALKPTKTRIASIRSSRGANVPFELGRLKMVIKEAEYPHANRLKAKPKREWDTKSHIWFPGGESGGIVFGWEDIESEATFIFRRETSKERPLSAVVIESSTTMQATEATHHSSHGIPTINSSRPQMSYLSIAKRMDCTLSFANLQFLLERSEKMAKTFHILTVTVDKLPMQSAVRRHEQSYNLDYPFGQLTGTQCRLRSCFDSQANTIQEEPAHMNNDIPVPPVNDDNDYGAVHVASASTDRKDYEIDKGYDTEDTASTQTLRRKYSFE